MASSRAIRRLSGFGFSRRPVMPARRWALHDGWIVANEELPSERTAWTTRTWGRNIQKRKSTSNLATPFFAVYMLQRLQLPFWVVTLLATLSSIVGLLLNRSWARLKEQFGIRPVVLVATLADAFMPLCSG